MSRAKTTTLLRRHRRTLAGVVAAVAAGGLLAGCGSSSGTTASTAAATPAAATSSSPQGVPPGMGTTATGAAADRAKAAALAKYPGTAERVEKLSDGSYVVHVIQESGREAHVKVSKDRGRTSVRGAARTMRFTSAPTVVANVNRVGAR